MAPESSDPKAVGALLDELSHLRKRVDDQGRTESEAVRETLVSSTLKLLYALRSPEENLFAIAQQPAQNAALRCAIALNIPSHLPLTGKSKTAAELAELTGADITLLVRILRACTITGIFAETGEQQYAHNALSLPLHDAANRALLTLMYDYNGRAVIALPEFLAARKWRDPGSYTECAFMLGSRTDMPMWDYRDHDPQCRQTFDLGMESDLVAKMSTGSDSGPFPWERLLDKDSSDISNSITLVDVGGGHGHFIQSICREHPKLAGRFILLDLAPVIKDAISMGLPSWIETSACSFFDQVPLPGARAYLIRRTLHNWDDKACKTILRNVAAAMDVEISRLIIIDMVVGDVDAAREMAWEDLNMMTIGGIERTERQWRVLLEDSGLSINNIWRNKITDHAAIEARLSASM